ncbi:hypothetical protein Nocox_30955 [Nonomuraea coxensis DSM 45129]|uniref:DUF1918 domain-containing protein n=2 Tax=Nonomuraea coxensis TaxID=404386 RepID=A0ABX8U7M7_9ACTN|nr:DUF1918 domain-containing protein [Nonomuraea coxensis]QYC43772.1 hypothetical protein Nocox_30955 [Nonomuraea coxensis DSM 45129]
MKATAGDRLLAHAGGVEEKDRSGVITEAQGSYGEQPRVARSGGGHSGPEFPGPDAVDVPT